MNFFKKNWIIASCILIILACFYLIRNGISSFNYPKGGVNIILMFGIVFGINLIFSLINKRFGDKCIRKLDRIFVYIAVPVLIFTSFGIFQKIQINNANKEIQSIIENRIQGQEVEGKQYDQVTYGELAPILQILNDRSLVQAEKEKEYLDGLDNISEMISVENLGNKQTRRENMSKINALLKGIKKYKTWMHSEIALREEKLNNLKNKDAILPAFHTSSQITLSLNDELMDSYTKLILSIKEVVKFVEKYQKNLKLVNENIEWENEQLEEDFTSLFNAILDKAKVVDAIIEKQTAYQQQMLEKT